MVTEKKKPQKVKPEIIKAIKEFLGANMEPMEVARKLSVPYHQVYYYSSLNKRRKATIQRHRVAGTVPRTAKAALNRAVENNIRELEIEKGKIDAKIEALRSLL